MNRFLVLLSTLVLLTACKSEPVKLGTNLPSGNGQTTSNKSVSIVPASDAVFTVGSGELTTAAPDGGFATEGTLSALNTKTPAKGTAAMSGSSPVTIATDDTVSNKLTQPVQTAAITKSDSTDTSSICTKGVWVGTAGDLAVIGSSDVADAGAANTLKNVPSGSFVPGSYKRIMSTNTSASNLVCFY